jgi:hypothetical protein
MAEVLGLGYLVTGIIVASLIAITAIGWRIGLHSVLSFWVIYILTRPLGASIGDYLSQPSSQGGLGLGATVTSLIFVVGIVGIVAFLSATKADVIPSDAAVETERETERGGMLQTIVLLAVVLVAGGTGYSLRVSSLQQEASDSAAAVQPSPGGSQAAQVSNGGQAASTSPLGDLSTFRVITQDTLGLLDAGDQAGATARVTDLEIEWDNGEARLKPKDKAAWTEIDGKIDTVLRELRATSPDANSERAALTALLSALG